MAQANCDTCVYNVYDEEDEQYYCEVDMDEDDVSCVTSMKNWQVTLPIE